MKTITYSFALLLMLSACSQNKTKQDKTPPITDPFTNESNLIKKHSLGELGSALNIMRAISDRPKTKEFCDLNFEQASLMAQQLRFIIEEKIDEMANQKQIATNPPEDWRRCQELCNCYAYARAYNDQHHYFNKKMSELNSLQAYQCAKKVDWFCGSELHQYLKSLSVLPESNY